MQQVEVLAPAGSMECLKAAILAGADAVYIGGSMFGARAYAKNLTQEEMLQAIDYVHIHGRKLYMTVNTLLKDAELEKLYDYLNPYYQQGLDGVIVQDIGVVRYLRRQFPDLPVHASTQMTLTSSYGAKLMKKQGITRVVPARELSLEEVRKIKSETGLEVECFVHGAMCYCYSGQCLLSSMIGGRSGNRGQCAQPCRLPYQLPNTKQADLMSLKDMCTIELIPELIEAGIDSFKIEGRMKQPEYVYTVTHMYRKYVDLYQSKGASGYKVSKNDLNQSHAVYRRRGYTQGYYKQHNGRQMISFERPECEEEAIQMPKEKLQESIIGTLSLKKNQPSRLSLELDGLKVEAEGAVCEVAMKQPLDQDRVKKQICKLGNTEFSLKKLKICMDSDIFLPMQALNELRRNAVDQLEHYILEQYRRTAKSPVQLLNQGIDKTPQIEKMYVGKELRKKRLSVLVRTMEQLKVATKHASVGEIYIDSPLCFTSESQKISTEMQKKGIRCYAALPYILREPAIWQLKKEFEGIKHGYNGVLIRNYESLEFLKEQDYTGEIQGDYNLYIFNKSAKKWMKEWGISRCTAPVELNERELGLLDISDCMFIGYGYQPVMITAGCIKKTTSGCDKKNQQLDILDRYRNKFHVQMCCDYCYNVIYNTSPLYLGDKYELLKSLNPGILRLDFSNEDARCTENVIRAYESAWIKEENVGSSIEFTRGHIKRGVK